MRFDIRKQTVENLHKFPTDDVQIAQRFAEKLKEELGDFLVTSVLFGSTVRKTATKGSDIDILIVGDDVSFELTSALIETYRIITENTIAAVSRKLHVTSMTLTSFWEYIRAGDPVAINILRDGVALLDQGFFTPMQVLLRQGRIRPTEESIWRYFGRAPKTITNSRWHIMQATLDLYWACIDSAHAALMRHGQTPPTPEHAADMLHKTFVRTKKLPKTYADTMHKFYKLQKQITHRELKRVTGAEYDKLSKEAIGFVNKMHELIQKPA